jgi:pantoate--beta-alanine ligase
MDRCQTIADMRTFVRAQRRAGKRIGFVPTMGALHAGHISLVKHAQRVCDLVVVSIYVNPTQFDNPEDFAKYPQTVEADCAMLTDAGVAAVFLPTTEEMFPDGYASFVEVIGPLTDKLCAVARPGHFRGVATVVTKLLNIVQPDVAVFGEKDMQQAFIISKFVRDLDIPVEISIAPTVREADGLAMSSRNRRLDAAGRAKALGLPRGLELANRAFVEGERNAMKLCEYVYDELLSQDNVEVDYCDLVSLKGFTEVENADDSSVLAAAVFVDGVRLIDHVHLGRESIPVNVE